MLANSVKKVDCKETNRVSNNHRDEKTPRWLYLDLTRILDPQICCRDPRQLSFLALRDGHIWSPLRCCVVVVVLMRGPPPQTMTCTQLLSQYPHQYGPLPGATHPQTRTSPIPGPDPDFPWQPHKDERQAGPSRWISPHLFHNGRQPRSQFLERWLASASASTRNLPFTTTCKWKLASS